MEEMLSLAEPSGSGESCIATPQSEAAEPLAFVEPARTEQTHIEHGSPTMNPATAEPPTLAPWYHTIGIVLLLLLYAFVAHLTHRAPHDTGQTPITERIGQTARALAETPKVPLYCSTIMLSWMLLASVVAGLYRRRAFFLAALRRRFASRWADPAIGFGIYLSFLTTISMLLFLLTAVLAFRAQGAHMQPRPTAGHTQEGGSTRNESADGHPAASSPSTNTENMQAVQKRVQRMLRFDQRAVASLVPRTLPEMLLWVVLSFTAAFSEEHIFRGYLLHQSLAFTRRFRMPPWLASALSVLATSVLFGSLHLYEGVGGAVVITLLGTVFAVVALALGNLRAVIVAHFLQDFLGGLTYYLAHRHHIV